MVGIAGARCAAMGLGLGLLLLGCAPPAPPPGPAATAPAPSFDGRWVGSVRITGASPGVDPANCAVEPGMDVQVSGNRFQYTQSRPALVASAPSLRDIATTAFTATIAPNGTITGVSDGTGATMNGRVEGTRMSGNIYGLLCYYSFTADRR